MSGIKHRVHEILRVGKPGDRVSQATDVALMTLICLNVVALVLETVGAVASAIPRLLLAFEILSVGIFTGEYALRLWSSNADERFPGAVKGRLRWALTPLALVDLAAILPFYLPFLGLDLRFARALRLLRLLRLAKLARYSEALHSVGRVFQAKKPELVTTLMLLGLALLLSSSLMYFAEHDAQPEVFSSIPAATWWAVATLSTVGYGDVYPITPAGKLLGSVIAVLGIGIFALPTGILGAAWVEEVQRRREAARHCPHCGEPIP